MNELPGNVSTQKHKHAVFVLHFSGAILHTVFVLQFFFHLQQSRLRRRLMFILLFQELKNVDAYTTMSVCPCSAGELTILRPATPPQPPRVPPPKHLLAAARSDATVGSSKRGPCPVANAQVAWPLALPKAAPDRRGGTGHRARRQPQVHEALAGEDMPAKRHRALPGRGDQTPHELQNIVACHVARLRDAGGGLEAALILATRDSEHRWAFLHNGPRRAYTQSLRQNALAYQELGVHTATEMELRGHRRIFEREGAAPGPAFADRDGAWLRIQGYAVPVADSVATELRQVQEIQRATRGYLEALGAQATQLYVGRLPYGDWVCLARADFAGRALPDIPVSTGLRWCKLPNGTEPVPRGTELWIPGELLRFSQSSVSERFAGKAGEWPRRSILETTLQLWSGELSAEDLPVCSVVWHEGRWHMRTGNRRLVAQRLLYLHAPGWFEFMKVCTASPRGTCFFKERFTTRCAGEWISIRETGEFIGISKSSYATDLLEAVIEVDS